MCVGRCKMINKCFFVRPYFLCNHAMCYNVANKFRCCIICGENRWRVAKHRAIEREFIEVEMTNSILAKGSCEKLCCCRAT